MFSLAALGCGASPASGPDDGGGGGGACTTCLLHGTWKIDNLSPCFADGLPGGDGGTPLSAAISTTIAGGAAQCPNDFTTKPTAPWSTDALTTDCAGQYTLCVTLKAGDPRAPQAGDCTLAQSCAEGDYAAASQAQTWTALPSWLSSAAQLACAMRFRDSGGYSEASVSGTATGCGTVGRVLFRVGYRPAACNNNPNGPGCDIPVGGAQTF